MTRKVEISHRTIIFTAIFIFLIWFFIQVRDIILLLFISIILMSSLNPLVDKLERYRIPRGMAIMLLYILLWGSIATVFASIIPSLVEQTSRLIKVLPSAITSLDFFSSRQQEIGQQVITRVGSLPENLLKLSIGIFGNLLNVLTTIVITFYLLMERKNLNKYLLVLTGDESPERATRIVNEIERRLGSWVRGQLILMVVVGVVTYVGLRILGVDIALPLAMLAGMLEIIPNIGPIVSSVPAVLIAFLIHPLLAVSTAALYFLVQFLENNLLVPKVMQKATGVNPLISILGLMIGLKLAGPVGAVLAIPTIIVIQTIGLEFFSLKHLENLTS